MPELTRRHTDLPPPYTSQLSRRPDFPPPQRTMSAPDFADDIDMNLAYGDLPPPLPSPAEKEQELQSLMSKLDKLMLEAQCIQHSATTIMSSLQQNPDAMAAVALTLAEISKIITKMSPGILSAIKTSSPAIFALLASPQFLIAGGVAVGVTIVMFGGYKIIKKIQSDAAERTEEANRFEEAMVYEGELGSIESWRRGIADVEARSVATSVDGEFITPAAAKLKKEKIRDRAKEERIDETQEVERHETNAPSRVVSRAPSVACSSQSTVKHKEGKSRTSSRKAYAETIATESTVKPRKESKDKKGKKHSALAIMFKKTESKHERALVKASSHKPRLIEV